uniref:50S ribosomal protein L20 n=2 Tax=Geranium TaxID=4028 RepID=B7T3L5_9ROSI|nr:ribosomal protein L20 [Geranium palmatum]YP_009250219.1 ribosomal protein L20 [Geranium maderense]ACH47412.1 ribosomal protein L20 [Geranium palmatum]ADJ66368.1 ribosomal protein L20 [Geranium palmatum]AMY96047.1 ribosomal protein L20 [Geranium maderense]
MSRTTRGSTARKRRSKMDLFSSGARGAHSSLARVIAQATAKALASADRDRVRQKRDFRRLWITRINAVIRKNGVFNSYNKFIFNIYKEQLVLNRKMLAQIAISNSNCLYTIYSYLKLELSLQNFQYQNSSEIFK